jgi:formate hydrogenlyase subunit 3/multisubunit Na+/H+ antiporter MnhD subunit
LAAREPLLAATVLAGSLLAAGYMYRLTEAVWFGDPAPRGPLAEAPRSLLVGLLLLTLAIVGVGLANATLVATVIDPAASQAVR